MKIESNCYSGIFFFDKRYSGIFVSTFSWIIHEKKKLIYIID